VEIHAGIILGEFKEESPEIRMKNLVYAIYPLKYKNIEYGRQNKEEYRDRQRFRGGSAMDPAQISRRWRMDGPGRLKASCDLVASQ
jgi:hypothetical protein